MKTNKVISVNCVGERTGRIYQGSFTVKMLMSQQDEFTADLRRRQIIGPSPEGTPPATTLQWKAFILGQLQARCTSVPKFWEDANYGLEIVDSNVIIEIYDELMKAEEEFNKEMSKDSEEALKKLKKKVKKDEESDEEDTEE